jgi:hypothetical protein
MDDFILIMSILAPVIIATTALVIFTHVYENRA